MTNKMARIDDITAALHGAAEAPIRAESGRVIQSVDRALSILEEVAMAPEGMTLTAMGERLGLHRSTCHHLVATLVARGYLEQVSRSAGYALGPRLAELHEMVTGEQDPAVILRDDLEALHRKLGYGVQLAVLSETTLLTKLSFRDPDSALKEPSELDKMQALHATATGKAILAWIPDTELVRVISENGLARYTPRTITTLSELVEELRLVRRRKYAVDDEEFADGVVCIGGAVRDRGGAVVASISATMPAEDATEEGRAWLIREITTAANDYSNKLRARAR